MVDCLEDRVLPTITIFEIPDVHNPGFIQLRIVGDNFAQNLAITDNQGGLNQIGINGQGTTPVQRVFLRNPNGTVISTFLTSAMDGLTTTTGLFVNVSSLDINLSGGNDSLTYNLTGFNAGAQTRSISVNMGAGNNSFTVSSLASIVGANITINYLGGTGIDTVNYTFAGIDNSRVSLTGDTGLGNDSATVSFTGTITNQSVVTNTLAMNAGNDTLTVNVTGDVNTNSVLSNNLDLGGGTNVATYTQSNSVLTNAEVNLKLLGGANVDHVSMQLNNTVLNTGQFNAAVDLGASNDVFNGSYGPGFQITGAGAQASIDVGGGVGNDTINFTGTGAGATIAGLLDVNLHGDAGNDFINDVANGPSSLVLTAPGNYRLRIDGGDGNDTIGVNLSNTAASTGNYDIAINGGNGADSVGFSLATNAAAGLTFNPQGSILLDGGPPAPFPGQLNNTVNLINPDNAPIIVLNFP
jgi:hypothetical protein